MKFVLLIFTLLSPLSLFAKEVEPVETLMEYRFNVYAGAAVETLERNTRMVGAAVVKSYFFRTGEEEVGVDFLGIGAKINVNHETRIIICPFTFYFGKFGVALDVIPPMGGESKSLVTVSYRIF